ncbi:MAG: imidazole glycerol phosphate synthase subunit HisH [Epulopiscium sp. Nele67-Bin002]|nr:MAG: imidazole glycerol phosphate synthase subunit HisH [Epulopiscium sp. Nele67-Bin002]OON92912.1 MAG: imidazole glycerol phosphate synthase, glutamine amidotransferase subunit [Epulopiscium sp. Nele67-Bin001]
MVAIIDYGVGNLFSLNASLNKIGQQACITNDINVINQASHIILPGVGAFSDAAKLLSASNMDKVLMNNKKPILGICLGMQLLFEKSYEFGITDGLGLIPGEIVPLKGKIHQKIPHMGWNKLDITNSSPILNGMQDQFVYFVHSFYANTNNKYITSVVEYDIAVTATVQKDNIFGCQFHPEKSGEVGLRLLKYFCEYK